MCRRAVSAVGCRSPPFQSGLFHFKNFRLEEKRMAYNNGRENRKWLIWKEAEEKILREHGVDETTIEKIRIDDRADFNSNRRFYHWTNNFGEYIEGIFPKGTDYKPTSPLMKEELRKLDEITAQVRYMSKHKISTLSDLQADREKNRLK